MAEQPQQAGVSYRPQATAGTPRWQKHSPCRPSQAGAHVSTCILKGHTCMEGSVLTMLQMPPKPDLRPQGLRTLDHLDHTSAATKRKNNILKLWCNTQNIKLTILIIFHIQLCGVRYSLTILTLALPSTSRLCGHSRLQLCAHGTKVKVPQVKQWN